MDETGLLATPAPRRITPGIIRGWDFPRVMRGVDTGAVEAFRAAVLDEVTLLLDENRELTAEVQRLGENYVPVHGAPVAETHVGEQAARILLAAQRQSEQIITDGQRYAQQVGSDADRQRQQALSDARARAEKLIQVTLEDATRQAADILAKAPGDARAQVIRLRAFGDSLEALLDQLAKGVTASLLAWRADLEELAVPANGAGH